MIAQVVTPLVMADGPTLEEVIAEWNGGYGRVAISGLARDMGVNASSMRKRAHKMKVTLEYSWVRDSEGRRQSTLCTDTIGAIALRAWYAK